MQTPIQKLRSDLKKGKLKDFKEYLSMEKQEIETAYSEGSYNANRGRGSAINTTAEDYYKMKFKK